MAMKILNVDPPAPPVSREEASRSFERGVDWALAHAERLSADARTAVLAGLRLADPPRAEMEGAPLRKRPEIRLSPVGKVLDVLSLGVVSRRIGERRRRENAFFELIEKDPSPLARQDLDAFRRTPDSLPGSVEEMQRVDGPRSNAALTQASLGRVEEPVLSWLRREDLWGYDLSHQLLAWVVCVKLGHRLDEARERSGRLAWRLFHEIAHCALPVHYDLAVERVAFLGLAGFPRVLLNEEYRRILSSQDPRDGGWWFTRNPADQRAMLDNAHLGASPLVRPARPYREQPGAEAVLERIEFLHRGHATGLSLWALGLLLGSPAGDTQS